MRGRLAYSCCSLASSASRLEISSDSCELSNVGAGFTGLWAAYYLKQHNPQLQVALFEAKYPRFYNAMTVMEKEPLIELMIELCDVFDLHRDLTAEVAKRYKEHRLYTGSLEDRDWPEN